MRSWDEAVAFALSLPGTELDRYYRQPAVRLAANGRFFLNVGHEPDTSFVLHLDPDTIEMLKATAPHTFWQTPHYHGSRAVLVRFDSPDRDRVRAIIERSRDEAARLPWVTSRRR